MRLFVLGNSFLESRKLKAACSPLHDQELSSWLESVKNCMKLKSPVSLLVGEHINCPMVMGHSRPVILLPAGLFTRLQTEEMKLVILHELVHVKQKDGWIHAIELFMRCFLFFNPLFLWMCSIQARRREICCDQAVISYAKDRSVYARALVVTYEYALNAWRNSLAFIGNGFSMTTRIEGLLKGHYDSKTWRGLLFLAVSLVILYFLNPEFRSVAW